MNVLSLFSGIGGIELGLERAGMTVVGQVEIDPYCTKVLAKHWPDVPRHDDVHTAADWWQSQERPTVDLICGGFPCQPVSNAGRRLGTDDERWLWPAFADTIRLLRPRWVLLENTPGIVSPVPVRGGDGGVVGYRRAPVEDVLGDLAALGYDCEGTCISAAAVGAPHLRWRWFCIARNVADTDGAGLEERQRIRSDPRTKLAAVVGSHTTLADTDGSGSAHDSEGAAGKRIAGSGNGDDRATGSGDRTRIFSRRPTVSDWWATEPGVDGDPDGLPAGLDGAAAWERGVPRVAMRVPNRTDRLRAIGNAVVPQVAQYIGELILAADREVTA